MISSKPNWAMHWGIYVQRRDWWTFGHTIISGAFRSRENHGTCPHSKQILGNFSIHQDINACRQTAANPVCPEWTSKSHIQGWCLDNDPELKKLFERANPHLDPKMSFSDMKDFYETLLRNKGVRDELTNVDIMTVSTPCQGRSNLRTLNEIQTWSKGRSTPHRQASSSQASHIKNDTAK